LGGQFFNNIEGAFVIPQIPKAIGFSFDQPYQLVLQCQDLAELNRQLPPGYQTIFNMHAVEGYSHVEIGKILGINEGTSRSQYSRARTLLIGWIKKISSNEKNGSYARP
jgi:RNA polymerase sigma-70 factor (ECF subfamily)